MEPAVANFTAVLKKHEIAVYLATGLVTQFNGAIRGNTHGQMFVFGTAGAIAQTAHGPLQRGNRLDHQ
ncbi:MAG: hypothetical protein BWY57_02449 [Betaproteobacteria bacterium ADurb.Bin341]|nr:MAG: hypothetical protein BWY57_02449 [Betaproteobacteria bacterium ADurb.Bin341]